MFRWGTHEAIGSDVPNLMKDVLNFMKDVPRVPNFVRRWGSAPYNFLMGSKMKSWTIHVQIGAPNPGIEMAIKAIRKK